MTKAYIFFLFALPGIMYAQGALPPLAHQFDLNNGSAFDHSTNQTGTVSGSVSGYTDRFGNAQGATAFSGDGASITARSSDNQRNPQKTVSFWTYINNPVSISGAPLPSFDHPQEIYNYVHNSFSFEGMARNDGTVGFNRYVERSDATKVPFYLWNIRPVNFDQEGWYHVVHVHASNYTRIYLFKPDGTMGCALNYMGNQAWTTQNQSVSAYLVLGGYANSVPIHVLDDFKVYSGILTETQVTQLHQQELPPCTSNSNTPCNPSTLLSTLTEPTLTVGNYFLITGDKCAVVRSDTLGWYHYKGTDGSTNYSPCDTVKVTLGSTSSTVGMAPDTLKLNDSYLSIDTGIPPIFTVMTANSQVPNYGLKLSIEASGFTTYQLSSSGGADTLVFEQEGLVSFPYQLMAPPTPDTPSGGNTPVFSSTDNKALIGGLSTILGGLSLIAGYGLYKYFTSPERDGYEQPTAKYSSESEEVNFCKKVQ